MLTSVTIVNFKRLHNVKIELGERVVFIGPNNSGKTSALQALSLWSFGLNRWQEKRAGKPSAKRSGVLISRRDISAIPIPALDQLWTEKRLRVQKKGKQSPNILLEIIVEGVTGEKPWVCGLEFDYRDEDSIYVRPSRAGDDLRLPIPLEAAEYRVAMLPPMSGLAAFELKIDKGAIETKIGQGLTAEVLRNMCYLVYQANDAWKRLDEKIFALFGVKIDAPQYVSSRGEIEMSYRDEKGIKLDISAAGRGLQQTLMLLAYFEVHPKSVLLLDEPDAHLEIVRQREIYSLLAEYAEQHKSQLIIASHSEVILDEAAQKDVVIAFVGAPHRIDDRGSQVRKALDRIRFVDYFQAEQKKRVLYLEGATDLSILRSIASHIKHDAAKILEQPFVKYVCNNPSSACEHFYGLREAVTSLRGFGLYDHLDVRLQSSETLQQRMWRRCEIENYLCDKDVLIRWARFKGDELGDPKVAAAWAAIMEEELGKLENALRVLHRDPWGVDIKASTDFLEPLFENFFAVLKIPNLMRKSNFHELAPFVESVDKEMIEVLDDLVRQFA